MNEINKAEHLLPIIRQHGSYCMAYSTLQDGLEYELFDGLGFIAYLSFRHLFWSRKDIKIVLADPVCAEENYQELLSKFIDKYKDVIFIQTSDVVAKILNDLGHEVNQFGIETELDVQNYDLRGKHKSKLRQWRNKCEREGVIVTETRIGDDGISVDAVKLLSEQWVKHKGGRELIFLTRPLRYETEVDVRYFQAHQNNELIAFSVFDPIYSAGKIVGYYHNIDRVLDTAPHGAGATVLLEAMKTFKSEGIELVSLGMSPLYMIKRTSYKYNNFFHDALFFAYKNLDFLYPFQGNANHKKKFNGETKPVYFSSTNGNNLWQLFKALKAIRLF